ncbi:MAG: hypothetical protein JRI23_01340, partial [Deltaproteobacteria bacterium]|nr:hypothetical protein [Deltaproteobacteria bacterium]MBW2530105.1 hypothetical protein [Deltaproteobacteria bacterium]
MATALLLAAEAAHGSPPVEVTVVENTAARTVLRYRVGSYRLLDEAIGLDTHALIDLPGESRLEIAGAPELPTVHRSVLVGSDSKVEVRVLAASYHEQTDIDVVPSKGKLYRSVDPASVPRTFGPAYQSSGFYPGDLVERSDPYLLRSDRGVVVRLQPFQYDPAARVLRVYDEVTIEVVETGLGTTNVLSPGAVASTRVFDEIAQHHFVNALPPLQAVPPGEEGEMLIIAHDAWLPNVQALVDHKNSIGIPTTAIGVSTIGNDPNSIKAHLQAVYDSSNLAFVLLVGDASQVAPPMAWGGAADPIYAKLAGNDDYPDVLVGRFSANDAAQVDTQVARTIAYELGRPTEQPWFKTALGIGSEEGPGDDNQMDWEHIDGVREVLLGGGYTAVDQLYGPSAGAGAVTAALQQGRGLINYCGHGHPQGWSTTGFSNGHVAGLGNSSMLPFIVSVACNNGEFHTGDSFAESWLWATKAGEPVGAVGIYASSISQAWNPPMAAQDRIAELFVAEQFHTLGGLAFAGSCRMLDKYGADGVEMFDTWILFGDPSLRVVGVVEPASGLQVSPAEGFAPSGPVGGPFDPAEQTYLLEAGSASAIDFSVHHTVPWLTVTPAAGTIPAGGSTTVTVALNEQAPSLPAGYWEGALQFVNDTDHEGDCERFVGVTVGGRELRHDWPLDEDPGWTVEGAWGFGVPAGAGGTELGNPDPTSGHTGAHVYGYELQGDYTNELVESHLTTSAIDCSELYGVTLRFWRWLNVEGAPYDHASVRVSNDGESWTTVWENAGDVADGAWQQVDLDLADLADGQPTVFIRWTMGATDQAMVASGWNVDDVQLWAFSAGCGDRDGDGYLPVECGGDDCDDDDPQIHPGAAEICDDGADNDCDGAADDADPLCPGSGGAGLDDDDLGNGIVGIVCGCRL